MNNNRFRVASVHQLPRSAGHCQAKHVITSYSIHYTKLYDDGTEINDVQSITVIERPTGEDVHPGGIGAVYDTKLTCLGNLSSKADAAATDHTTLLVVNHATAKIHLLALGDLRDSHTAILQVNSYNFV